MRYIILSIMALPCIKRSAPAESNTREPWLPTTHPIFKPSFSGFAKIPSVELTIPV